MLGTSVHFTCLVVGLAFMPLEATERVAVLGRVFGCDGALDANEHLDYNLLVVRTRLTTRTVVCVCLTSLKVSLQTADGRLAGRTWRTNVRPVDACPTVGRLSSRWTFVPASKSQVDICPGSGHVCYTLACGTTSRVVKQCASRDDVKGREN